MPIAGPPTAATTGFLIPGSTSKSRPAGEPTAGSRFRKSLTSLPAEKHSGLPCSSTARTFGSASAAASAAARPVYISAVNAFFLSRRASSRSATRSRTDVRTWPLTPPPPRSCHSPFPRIRPRPRRLGTAPARPSHRRQGRAQPLHGARRSVSTRVGQNHQELLAAVAPEDVGVAHCRMHRAHEGLQHLIAGGVAPRVVDGLEVIEVEQGDAERQTGALDAALLLLETRHQRAAVGG